MNTFKTFIEQFNANKLNNVKLSMLYTKNKYLADLGSVRFIDVLKDKYFDTEVDSMDSYALKNKGSFDNFAKKMAKIDQDSLNEKELVWFDQKVKTFTVDAVRLFASRILDRADLEKYPIYMRKTNKWRISHWGPVNPNGNPVKDDLSGFVDPEPIDVNGEQFMFKVPYGYDVVYEESVKPELFMKEDYDSKKKFEKKDELYKDIAFGDKILCYDVPVNKYLYYNEYLVNINNVNIPNGVLTSLGKYDSRYEMSNVINSLYKAYGGDVLGTLADRGRDVYYDYRASLEKIAIETARAGENVEDTLNVGFRTFVAKSLYRSPVMSTLNNLFTKNRQNGEVFDFSDGKDEIRYNGDQEKSKFYNEIFEREFEIDKTNHYVGNVYDKCRCSISCAKHYYNHKDESYKMFTILKLVKFLKNQILPIVNLYKKNDPEILTLKEFVIQFVNDFDIQSLNDRYLREIEFLNDFEQKINNPNDYIQKAKKYAEDIGFEYRIPNLGMLKSRSFAVRTTASMILSGIYVNTKDEKFKYYCYYGNFDTEIDRRMNILDYSYDNVIRLNKITLEELKGIIEYNEIIARLAKLDRNIKLKIKKNIEYQLKTKHYVDDPFEGVEVPGNISDYFLLDFYPTWYLDIPDM